MKIEILVDIGDDRNYDDSTQAMVWLIEAIGEQLSQHGARILSLHEWEPPWPKDLPKGGLPSEGSSQS